MQESPERDFHGAGELQLARAPSLRTAHREFRRLRARADVVRTDEGGTVNKDEAEGRVKEAAGDLSGDKDLQREGKVDQAEGKTKDAVDSASDKAKDVIDRD